MPESADPDAELTAGRAIGILLRGHRLRVALVAVASVVGGLTEAVFLVLVTRAAFAITAGQDEMGVLASRSVSVPIAMALALALVVVRIGLALLANWQSSRLTADVANELRRRMVRAFLRSTWAAKQASPLGRLQALVGGFTTSGMNLVASFASGVIAACSLGAMLLLAIGVDPFGSLVAVVAVAALGSVLRPLRRKVRLAPRRNSDDGMRLAMTTSEVAELGVVMHVFDVRTQLEDGVFTVLEDGRRSAMRLNLVRGLVSPIYSGIAYIVLVGALTLASASSSTKLTSLGAVMLVMLRSLSYGQALQGAYSGIHASLPQVRDLFDEIDLYEGQEFIDSGDPIARVCPLVLDDVSFHYVDDQPVLKHVSATIAAGEMVGIVGPSGSGKSTLVQLLLGLRTPVEGCVLADGKDIRSLLHHDWARKVTFVPQSPVLVNGSVADNIRFHRDGITDAHVERAARLAGLHDEIVAFPNGYDHQVGDRGGNLSGGQQQRLCIARALAGDPEVLILDEPTSALDARSEALIRETLEGLRGRMTILVIAHRLSTIEECDRIMVIQHGEIAALDAPAVLKASSNFYADAVRLSSLG